MQTRPQNVVDLAHAMGIEGNIPVVPSIALGAGDLSLHDMVQAYSVFANRGERVRLRYVERIEDRAGNIIYRYQSTGATEVGNGADPRRGDFMRGMLESVVDEGTGRRLRWRYKLEGKLAGKTGTSQNHSDGWFIGFTPKLLGGCVDGRGESGGALSQYSCGPGRAIWLYPFGENS